MEAFSFCATVLGSAHRKRGVVCQDASDAIDGRQSNAHVFAVADGHGDPTCVRSDVGSKLAVEIALEVLDGYSLNMDSRPDACDASGLPVVVVSQWRARVREHLAQNPLQPAETQGLSSQEMASIDRNPERLYGTTLIAGARQGSRLVLIRQGDGCCALLNGRGDLSYPLPEDELCIGEVTTSLCNRDADKRMAVVSLDLEADGFAACFVGTDGVDKSLGNQDGLRSFLNKVALDALGNASRQAMESIALNYLSQLSERGSGDDASLAGHMDVGAIAQCAPQLVLQRDSIERNREQEFIRQRLVSMRRKYDHYQQASEALAAEDEERDRFLAEYDELQLRLAQLEASDKASQPVKSVAAQTAEQVVDSMEREDEELPPSNNVDLVDAPKPEPTRPQANVTAQVAETEAQKPAPPAQAVHESSTAPKAVHSRPSIVPKVFSLLMIVVLAFGGGVLVGRLVIEMQPPQIAQDAQPEATGGSQTDVPSVEDASASSMQMVSSDAEAARTIGRELQSKYPRLNVTGVDIKEGSKLVYSDEKDTYTIEVVVAYTVTDPNQDTNVEHEYNTTLEIDPVGWKIVESNDQVERIARELEESSPTPSDVMQSQTDQDQAQGDRELDSANKSVASDTAETSNTSNRLWDR